MTTSDPRPRGGRVPVNGPALRALRIRSGISMAALATSAGIERSYLNKIEISEREVSPEVYHRLLQSLSIEDYRTLLREPVAIGDGKDAA